MLLREGKNCKVRRHDKPSLAGRGNLPGVLDLHPNVSAAAFRFTNIFLYLCTHEGSRKFMF